jgi:hypothetical protein
MSDATRGATKVSRREFQRERTNMRCPLRCRVVIA